MTEQVEREFEDTRDVYPAELMNDRARQVYDALLKENPWLPQAERVSAGSDLELIFGANREATLSLTVFINLPEDFQ
jgi:hypothetical protein